jgi:hypothetical protein
MRVRCRVSMLVLAPVAYSLDRFDFQALRKFASFLAGYFLGCKWVAAVTGRVAMSILRCAVAGMDYPSFHSKIIVKVD